MKRIYIPALLMLSLIVVSCGSKGPAYELKIKGKKGDVYQTVLKSSTEIDVMNTSNNQDFTFYMSSEVLDVADNGNITTQQKMTRVLLNQNIVGLGQINFDSDNSSVASEDEGINDILVRSFKNLVNQPMTVVTKPNGEMEKIEMADSVDYEVRKSAESNLNNSNLTLPDKPVKVGSKWDGKKDIEVNGIKMSIEMSYKLKDVKDNVAEIAATGKISSEKSSMAEISGTVKGTMYFDIDKGMLTKSDMEQDAEVKVATMTMKMKTKVTIEVK